jgi:hypothetical protein
MIEVSYVFGPEIEELVLHATLEVLKQDADEPKE